jgi:N-acetyl-anhydromuramyl-L-alanine amidase AmpD
MVGSYAGAMNRLDSQDRASWHFSVTKAGTVYQHYRVDEITWHAGSPRWNQALIGIEHEGGAPGNESEPLTPAQRDASVALVRWLSAQHGFPLTRRVSLWEHNEVAPPADPTSCPSHRIPWENYEEDDMALMLAECGDSPSGYRLYLLGQAAPVWITSPKVANELRTALAGPKGLSWETLTALGAK